MTDWVLAIDFGTTFTSAAIRVDGRAVLVRIHSPEGPRDVMPSAVFLPAGGGELVVGWVAENQAVLAPDRFEPTPKRRLGVDEHLLLGGEPAPVVTAVAAVLDRVFAEARRSRGETAPSRVSLTHPASWAGGRVDALVEAAHRAGIEAPRLLSEPEGAALHFATERVGTGGLVAVYDLGGGTFDAAVLERVGEASFRLAGRPGGRDGLGGEEFDHKLYEHVAKQLAFESPEHWARIRENPRSHRDFRVEVRRAKEALSYHASHDVYLPEAQDRLSWRVTREEFEDLIRPDLDASVEILARTLAEAGIDDPADPSQLADIYLAGGSSRIPLVVQAIGERLGRVPRSLDEPKSVVALGASNVERAHKPVPAAPPLPPPPAPHLAKPAPAVAEAPPPVAEPEPSAPTEAPPAPTLEPKPRIAAGDALVLGLALAGAALALFGTAIASARGVTRIVTMTERWPIATMAEWWAIEAVGVPVAVLAALVALRTARGHRLREMGLLLGLGVQMTLGAAGWLLVLLRTNDGGPRFEGRSATLAVPTLIGALLVLAAAVVAWRRRPRTNEPAVEPARRVRRVAALATLMGVALTVAAVFLWPWAYGDRVSIFRIESWFVVEQLGSAACAVGLAGLVALAAKRAALAGGALLALGLQSVLYFVPYIGPSLANLDLPPGPAGALGVLGALLVTGSGVWLWRTSEVPVRPQQDEPRWPVRLVAAGAAGILAGFAVSSSRSWTAFIRPDGGGVPAWRGTTWHFLEAIAVPALVAATLIALVRIRRGRAFTAGLLLGFGAQTLVAAAAALRYASGRGDPRGILAIVFAAAVVLAAASAAVAYRVRRDSYGGADYPASRPWIGMLGVAGAAGVAVALFLPDLGDQYGDGRSFLDVNHSLILEPAVAAGLLAVSAAVLLLRPALRLLAAGVLVAVGAQTLLWFITPIGVAISEPFDYVSLGLGSVIGALGALAGVTTGVLGYRRAASRAIAQPLVAHTTT